MKKISLLIISTITGLAITCLSAEGGRDGGGGNTREAQTTQWRIEKYIYEEKNLLNHFFFVKEALAEKAPLLKNELIGPFWSVYLKLFKNKNMQLLLEKIRISVQENPCLDQSGKEVDASVISFIENKICFSKTRLLKKLDDSDFQVRVFGLLAHEISHLAGASEEEAQIIQTEAEKTFLEDGLLSVARNSSFRYAADISKVVSEIDEIISRSKNQSTNLTCLLLGSIAARIKSLEEMSDRFMPFSSNLKLSVVELQIQLAQMYCMSDIELLERIGDKASLQKFRTGLTYGDLYPSGHPSIKNKLIRGVKHHDHETLISIMEDLKIIMREIGASVIIIPNTSW